MCHLTGSLVDLEEYTWQSGWSLAGPWLHTQCYRSEQRSEEFSPTQLRKFFRHEVWGPWLWHPQEPLLESHGGWRKASQQTAGSQASNSKARL